MKKQLITSLIIVLIGLSFTNCAKSFEQQEMDDMPKEFLEDEDYKADMQEHQRNKMLNQMRCGGGR